MFGNTGSTHSCTYRPTQLVRKYCQQEGVRVKELIDHLFNEKLI